MTMTITQPTNVEPKEPISTSRCDTYIEMLFKEKCAEIDATGNLYLKWQQDKKVYTSLTNTIVFEFWNFSLHDKTHSQRILDSIELLLGREQIDKLSISDLWLLLQCAYYHDVGMATTQDEIKNMWENDTQFKEYLNKTASDIAGLGKYAQEIFKIDNILRNKAGVPNDSLSATGKAEMEYGYSQGWELDVRRYVTLLSADYIRKNHAKRCLNVLSKLNVITGDTVEERMYDVVAKASCAHGENFEYLFEELTKHERGFGTTHMHPRFVAALLRIGDLLDMDNNRFDMKVLAYSGRLPELSQIHFDKHKALKNYSIIDNKIEANIESSEYAVCVAASDWFKWLEDDIENVIYRWNDICPEKLKGCYIQKSDLKVYYNDKKTSQKRLFCRDIEPSFAIDREKLLDLLIGNNIYDSKFVFIREYIQNALDATKMQIWTDIQKGRQSYWVLRNSQNLKKLIPYDLDWEMYRTKPVEIQVIPNFSRKVVKFEIKDYGIGMESACIKTISTIGKSWKGRPEYRKDIENMPEWLRPTGGFGIGLQSAFMVTDKVTIQTKSELEIEGTEILLQSPKRGGVIREQRVYSGERGTVVSLEVPLSAFLDGSSLKRNFNMSERQFDNILKSLEENSYFSKTAIETVIKKLVEHYVGFLQNTIIPITLKVGNKGKETFFVGKNYSLQTDVPYDTYNVENYIDTKDGKKLNVAYIQNERGVTLWNISQKPVALKLEYKKPVKDTNVHYYYKNIKFGEDRLENFPFEAWIDFYSTSVTDILHISRAKPIDEGKVKYWFLSELQILGEVLLNNLKGMSEKGQRVVLSENGEKANLSNLYEFILSYLVLSQSTLQDFKLLFRRSFGVDTKSIVGTNRIKEILNEIKNPIFFTGEILKDSLIEDGVLTYKEGNSITANTDNSDGNSNINLDYKSILDTAEENDDVNKPEYEKERKKSAEVGLYDCLNFFRKLIENSNNIGEKEIYVCDSLHIMNMNVRAKEKAVIIVSKHILQAIKLSKQYNGIFEVYTEIPREFGSYKGSYVRITGKTIKSAEKNRQPDGYSYIEGNEEILEKYNSLKVTEVPYIDKLYSGVKVLLNPLDEAKLETLRKKEKEQEIDFNFFKDLFVDDVNYSLLVYWVARHLNRPESVIRTTYNNLIEDLYIIYKEKGVDGILNIITTRKKDQEEIE